jgi:hypothetical protein
MWLVGGKPRSRRDVVTAYQMSISAYEMAGHRSRNLVIRQRTDHRAKRYARKINSHVKRPSAANRRVWKGVGEVVRWIGAELCIQGPPQATPSPSHAARVLPTATVGVRSDTPSSA